VQLLALGAFYDRKSVSGLGFAAVVGKKFDSTFGHRTCVIEQPVKCRPWNTSCNWSQLAGFGMFRSNTGIV